MTAGISEAKSSSSSSSSLNKIPRSSVNLKRLGEKAPCLLVESGLFHGDGDKMDRLVELDGVCDAARTKGGRLASSNAPPAALLLFAVPPVVAVPVVVVVSAVKFLFCDAAAPN